MDIFYINDHIINLSIHRNVRIDFYSILLASITYHLIDDHFPQSISLPSHKHGNIVSDDMLIILIIKNSGVTRRGSAEVELYHTQFGLTKFLNTIE